MKPVTKAVILAVLSIVGLFVACRLQAQDTAGVYTPTVIESVNTLGIVTPGQAHFIKKGRQVAVWGRVLLAGTVSQFGTRTYYSLSLPFPIALPAYPDSADGLMMATQNNTHDNAVGYVTTVPSGLVLFFYNATSAGSVNTYYSYAYTAQN